MPTFAQLIATLPDDLASHLAQAVGVHDGVSFHRVCSDSRLVESDDVFVLLKRQASNADTSAEKTNGEPSASDIAQYRTYLTQVADKAVMIVTEVDPRALGEAFLQTVQQPIIFLPDLRDYLGTLTQALLQLPHPKTLPTIVATTGTNGKTTVSQLIAQLVSHAHCDTQPDAQCDTQPDAQSLSQKTAVMGTAGNGILVEHQLSSLTPATHTTLEVMRLHETVYDYACQGVSVLSIEASSHGLHQQRLQGLPIKVAVFTNLSRDHLDYHPDMDEYARAKARLFDKAYFPSLTHAIINADDAYAPLMIETAKRSGVTVWTYSLQDATADFFAQHIAPSLAGVALTLATPVGDLKVTSPLLGRFNVANLLASIAGAMALGVTLSQIGYAVPKLCGASGRMERVVVPDAKGQGCFIVDYAHTPDALEQVLTSLRAHCTGDLWAVFGCGGDRDKGKRPLMAQAALRLADKVILTADNPRTEDPLAILLDMQAGMTDAQHGKTQIEPDRRVAIHYAVHHAKPNDIVVIAGKGHETYQEINGVRYEFDDRAVVREALAQAVVNIG